MKWHVALVAAGFIGFITGCIPLSQNSRWMKEEFWTTPTAISSSGDTEAAKKTLICSFDPLFQRKHQRVAIHFVVPHPMTFLYTEIDPRDGEALLARACAEQSLCRSYCWKIKGAVKHVQVSPTEFTFTVRFQDKEGILFDGGESVTPRVSGPPGCSKFSHAAAKVEDQFYLDAIPVFTGCWA